MGGGSRVIEKPRIAVFMGGLSAERDVSLGSGEAAAKALSENFQVDRFDVTSKETLPDGIKPNTHIVFSTLHGTFGEDGSMQSLLDRSGFEYAGCNAESSSLTFRKAAAKAAMSMAGVPVPEHIKFSEDDRPDVSEVLRRFGASVIIKPDAEGSSVGLAFAEGESEIAEALESACHGDWLVEPRIAGQEATIGLLDGKPLEIVEILPNSGAFDYESKYTKGLTRYIYPAEFSEVLTSRIKDLATRAFEACGCRDFARIDIMINAHEQPYFLEINTLPGLKQTSLLPMSASAYGYDFVELMQLLVDPAVKRFRLKYSNC